MEKTNVMRILDQKKIQYKAHYYPNDPTLTGMDIAEIMSESPDHVFKTLVTVGATNKYYVFDVPVNRELNLKKAARAVGEKKIEMLKAKDLLSLTGYVHGGCSPIGMKKFFTTTFDESVNNFDIIFFSAGRVGYQVALRFEDLKKVIKLTTADICN